MFIGEYKVSFLGKGRLSLPKKIRQLLSGNKVILSRGYENCIFGYETKQWRQSAALQNETPVTDQQGRQIRRYLFSGAMSVKFDTQGRIVVPAFLLDHARLDENIVIVGAGDHFEIWEETAWQKELKKISA